MHTYKICFITYYWLQTCVDRFFFAIIIREALQDYKEYNKNPNSISGITQRCNTYVIKSISYMCICWFYYILLKILVLFRM